MTGHAATVPLFSPQGAAMGVDLAAVIQPVLQGGQFVMGSQLAAFEQEFARYIGAADAVGVASGTDALWLALRTLRLESGSRVAMTANAGGYARTAAALLGLEPRYVDVDPRRMTMDPAALQDLLAREAVQAVLVTHLYGQMADMPALSTLCQVAGVPLVEDCAQAHGAALQGRCAGAWGVLGCFSFYPTKNLGAVGDAGALTLSDPALAERLRALRQYGWRGKYQVLVTGGTNSRLDELQAAVLRAKLPRLDAANARRRAIARRYGQAFSGLPVVVPAPAAGPDYVAHLYVLQSPQREALQAFLAERGIASAVHYPVPDHLQPAWQQSPPALLPETERVCRQVLTLPCHPGLQDAQVQAVIDAVQAFFTGAAARA